MKDGEISTEMLLRMLSDTREMLYEYEKSLKRKKPDDIRYDGDERFHIFFSHADDILFSFDTRLTILKVSPNVERILGYMPDELIGRQLEDLHILHPDDLGEALEHAHYVITRGLARSSIFQFLTKSGEKRFGEVNATPVFRDGRVVEVLTIARDITRRLETEKYLRETAEGFRSILNALSEAVSVIRIDELCFEYINDAFTALTGYSARDLQGKTPFDLVLHEDREELDHRIRVPEKDLTLNDGVIRMRRKDGSIAEGALTCRPLTYAGRACMLMVMSWR